jgi:glycosyltransferase involved in cell wall biosynthesis
LRPILGKLVYQPGGHDLSAHSPLYLFRAARTFINQFPLYANRVRITLVGDVARENAELAKSMGLQDHVTFTGRLPLSQALDTLSQCNLLFLPMRVIHNERGYDMSGKIYDYIALRRPILALTNPGDISDFLTRYKLGWCLDPYDDLRVAQLFKSILDNPEVVSNAFDPDQAQLSELSYPRLAEALAELLDRCVGMG